MTTDELGFLGVDELGQRFRQGTLSPLDAVRRALKQIERLDPVLNAFADPMAERALAEAELRGRELQNGQDRGPLHGIPVAIKDLIDVEGVPTGFGTRAHPPEVAKRDAELVRRLRQAGAVILGKTNLLEYAYGIAHPLIGQTNNPHDPSRTSGGSSGGSAAAVAAGIVPLAIGTDTGGSIRIPASYCGIVGLKPSHDLVPLDGVFPLSWTLDHAGPLARSVGDAAHALTALAGTPITLAPIALQDLRIGMIRRHFHSHEITSSVRQCLDHALGQLGAHGAVLVDIDIPELAEVNRVLMTLLLPEASVIHMERLSQNAEGYSKGTRAQIEAGFKSLATDYVSAMRSSAVIRRAVEACFSKVDILLSPSVPFVAPKSDPEIGDGEDGEILSSGFANVTGHPSLSLPAGFEGRLPVGLQVVGPLRRDARLLSIALVLEAELKAFRTPDLAWLGPVSF